MIPNSTGCKQRRELFKKKKNRRNKTSIIYVLKRLKMLFSLVLGVLLFEVLFPLPMPAWMRVWRLALLELVLGVHLTYKLAV